MKYFLTFILALTVSTAISKPKKEVDSTKVNVKFGGRIDVMAYFDTYNSVDSRNGVQYWFPKAPQYNSLGEDINFQNRVRFSIASTRLNFTVNVPKIGKTATGKAFVEADFMGVNEAVMTGIRLRHAYFLIDWEKQSLLMGQTSHLMMIDDIAPSMITFGGGFPLNTLNRPIQFRFTQRFLENSSLDVAAAMFSGREGDMQSIATIPDIHARLNFGFGKHQFGVAGGLKVIKPRALTADSTKATQNVVSFDALVYYKVKLNGHALAAFVIWGQDPDALSLIGGFAPLYRDREKLDYSYAPTSTISAWIDYQTPKYKGFYAGCFIGGQKNLGSMQKLDLTKASISNFGIDAFARVAPRIMYDYKMFTFGVEYMFSVASWAKEFDQYYCPTKLFAPTFDNRISLLARFKF